MSIITRGLPSTIPVGSHQIPVETGFRYWLEVCEVLDDSTLTDAEKAAYTFELLGVTPSKDTMDGIMWFMGCGKKRKRAAKKCFDYAHDAAEIVASFQMQYGIDLTDSATSMHWWRFRALFDGLCDDTPLMRLVRLRTAEPPKGEGRAEFMRAQREAALPKTSIQRDKEIWGDAWQMAP